MNFRTERVFKCYLIRGCSFEWRLPASEEVLLGWLWKPSQSQFLLCHPQLCVKFFLSHLTFCVMQFFLPPLLSRPRLVRPLSLDFVYNFLLFLAYNPRNLSHMQYPCYVLLLSIFFFHWRTVLVISIRLSCVNLHLFLAHRRKHGISYHG